MSQAIIVKAMLSFAKKYGNDMVAALNGSNIYFSVMLVQGSIESAFGKSSAAKNKNNFFGILSGNSIRSFATPQACFEYYVNLLSTKSIYVNKGVNTATDPYKQIFAIADAGYYSANNDWNIPAAQRPPNKVWTHAESAQRYYNTNKGFIDAILLALPIGKINNSNIAASSSSVTNLNV